MANRYKLPGWTRHLHPQVLGHEGYITVGMYEDDSPGEIFVRMAKEGSVIAGLWTPSRPPSASPSSTAHPCTSSSRSSKTRFEPCGFTGNQEIPIATSIMDYLFRWLAIRFPSDGSGIADRHPTARAAQLAS